MKFQKIEILEWKQHTNVFLGKIDEKVSILTGNKDLPDEIELNIKINNNNDFYKINENGVLNLYYPASNEIIDMYKNKTKIVYETLIKYETKIEPYIDSILTENTKWINKILNHKTEVDKILYKNKNFIIIKNIGWESNNDFYLLVIPYEPIKNIRHLRENHRILLNSMKKKGLDVAKRYNYEESDLYFFFHYHPSCYHLHLHICLINHKSLKFTIYRHVLLEDVLNNLNTHWKKIMKFEINISNPIYKLLLE